MGNSAWCVSNTRSGYCKCLSNKTEQSIYECLLGFSVLTTFSAPPDYGCIDGFLPAQFQKRRNDGWWFPLVLLLPVCLNSKRLWAHPVISRASAVASSIFHGVIPDAFWSSQNRICRKLNEPKQWVNFILLMLLMYVRCDESSLCSRINYVYSPDRELLCGSVQDN